MLRNLITDEGKYYLYRHIRLDKNEPFYIGKGTKIPDKPDYSRAYDKNRNQIWKNITNKTKYTVDIVLESDNLDFILNKEKEFIQLYGRIKNNTGSLANILEQDYAIQHEALKLNKLKRVEITKIIDLYKNYTTIQDFPNYGINPEGQVINFDKNKIVPFNYNKYKSTKVPIVWLSNINGHTSKPVRLLVAQHFISNLENKPEVINVDGNLNNNKVSNLKWVSIKERIQHNRSLGYDFQPSGADHYKSKLTNTVIKEVQYIHSHINTTHQELADLYKVGRHVITHLLNKIK